MIDVLILSHRSCILFIFSPFHHLEYIYSSCFEIFVILNLIVNHLDSNSWAAVQISVRFFYPGTLKWGGDWGRVDAQFGVLPQALFSVGLLFPVADFLQLCLLVLQARKTGYFHCSFSHPAQTPDFDLL